MTVVLLVSDVAASRRFYVRLGFTVVDAGNAGNAGNAGSAGSGSDDGVVLGLGGDRLELRSDVPALRGPDYFTPEIERFPRGTGVELVISSTAVEAAYAATTEADDDIVAPLEASGASS